MVSPYVNYFRNQRNRARATASRIPFEPKPLRMPADRQLRAGLSVDRSGEGLKGDVLDDVARPLRSGRAEDIALAPEIMYK